jgi:hypothetical protein
MTRARDLANIISGGFTADDIPNLDAGKITTGTFADARIAASNVSQHAQSFDDNKLVNDISTLALRQSSNENKAAYNTNSMYVDVFQDSTGVTGLTNVVRNSDGEFLSAVTQSVGSASLNQTNRTGEGLVVSFNNITPDGNFTGNPSNADDVWFDNSTNSDSSSPDEDWYFQANVTVNSDKNIKVDFGSSYSKVISGVRLYQSGTASSGTWVIEGSNDNSSFTTLSSNFTWQGVTADGSSYYWDVNFSNSTVYRYIRFKGVSGTTNAGPYQTQCYFKEATFTETVSATGSFESNAITAPSSTSSMGAIITYQDNAGTNALNTDIVLKLSADGGSNYSTATLTAMPDFASGIKMAKVNDLSVTAGTSLKYKLEFANQASGSKEARIRGVSLQY